MPCTHLRVSTPAISKLTRLDRGQVLPARSRHPDSIWAAYSIVKFSELSRRSRELAFGTTRQGIEFQFFGTAGDPKLSDMTLQSLTVSLAQCARLTQLLRLTRFTHFTRQWLAPAARQTQS